MNSKKLLLYNVFLRQWPSRIMARVRCAYLLWCGVTIGKNVVIENDVYVRGNGRIVIGDNTQIKNGSILESCGGEVLIGRNCEINRGSLVSGNCGSTITIEDDVHIAHNCSIKGSTHRISFNAIKENRGSIAGESVFEDIKIGRGSWLCAGSIILPGVTVGSCNVVAAGAVVTRSSPDNVLLAGVPATIKKKYE